MTETAMGGPGESSTDRPHRYFPSFVREPGVVLPPERPVPTEKEALAALQRYRHSAMPDDNDLVQRWISAAKGDPVEHARRIRLTA